ncbi:MAG: hypothetical protein QOH06_2173 [Acidobacteriota bacterium]|jgi:hypothetical protein|nr:hypothetical protein [Acidobacteriota bacterium]
MSTYQAIAAVSTSLQALLGDRMETKADVTLAPPGVELENLSNNPRINLYLYRVSENAALKNQEIPGQWHAAAYGHPPLSLNLHYLLTAYPKNEKNKDAETTAQLALGDAMRVLHDFAIFTPGLLNKLVSPHDPLLDSVLRNEFERIKITLEPLSLDELSKIWTSLSQASFRRSVSYEVSVVQIESLIPRRVVKPVEKRRIQLSLSGRPEITAVYRKPVPPEPPGDPRTKLMDTIVIKGRGFLTPKTRVRLGGLEPIVVDPIDDGTIEIAVPDNQYPIDADHPAPPRSIPPELQLQPGPQEVTVLVERETEGVQGGLGHGTAYAGKVVLDSNRSFFLLVPEVNRLVSPPFQGTATGNLTIEGKRLYHPDLKSFIVIGDVAIPVPETQPAPPPPPPLPQSSNKVKVPLGLLAHLTPGAYPLRVLVNGVQNLETGTDFNFVLS